MSQPRLDSNVYPIADRPVAWADFHGEAAMADLRTRARAEAEADAAAAEWNATAGKALLGLVAGVVLIFVLDPAGTVAIAVDLFRWWFA